MAEKVTEMLIKANWNCPRCAEKLKKIFAEYPQIRDQKHVEKKNAVLITVVSGCPEKIRQDIKLKGGKFLESVEIQPHKKPKKVFSEQQKETAKTPAPAPVQARPPKATNPAPTKHPKQVVVLPPPKEPKITTPAPTKHPKQVVVLPPLKEPKITKRAPTKPPRQVVVLPPLKEPKTTKRAPTEPPKQVVVLLAPKELKLVVLKGCNIYNPNF